VVTVDTLSVYGRESVCLPSTFCPYTVYIPS